MDMFLTIIVLFLFANVAVVATMLRRVNLDNESVIAWEQQYAQQQVAKAASTYNVVVAEAKS